MKASLLSQLKAGGKAAKLAALIKRERYSYAFTALTPGTLKISWYFVPRGAHLSATANVKPVLLRPQGAFDRVRSATGMSS